MKKRLAKSMIKVCKSVIEPTDFTVISSKGDSFYTVTASTLFSEAICDCPGFVHRGNCRHIKDVEESIRCRWMAKRAEDASLAECPGCGGTTVEFSLDPVGIVDGT